METIVKIPPRTPAQLSKDYGVPLATVRQAWDNLHRRSSVLVLFSGKIGAGKDTVAPLVMDLLGVPQGMRAHEFFAKALKDEMGEVFTIIRAAQSQESAVEQVMDDLGVTWEMASDTVGFIHDEIRSNMDLTPYIKTEGVRMALQHWGTNVRRAQDDGYWVKKALASTLCQLALGKSVQVTDARFPNELDAALGAGAYAARLEVSPEVQAARIMSRDGVVVTEAARNHPSETALDHYGFFDVRLDTDHQTPLELARTIAQALEGRAIERH